MFLPASFLWSPAGPQGAPPFLLWAPWVAALRMGGPTLHSSPAVPAMQKAELRACRFSSCIILAGHGPEASFLRGLHSLMVPGGKDLNILGPQGTWGFERQAFESPLMSSGWHCELSLNLTFIPLQVVLQQIRTIEANHLQVLVALRT